MSKLTIPLTLDFTPESKAFLAALSALEAGTAMAATPAAEPSSQTPPAHGEYWPGQGGRYICTLPALLGLPARHLIAGPECADQIKFGPEVDVPGATSHIDGRANTAALLASGKEHPAAHWAANCQEDGHTDFYLPAKLDLVMAHICAPSLFNKDGWYWTSTQLSRTTAFVQDFEYGHSIWGLKDFQHRVRAFRWIQAT